MALMHREIVAELVNYYVDLADKGHIHGAGPTNLSIGDMRDFVGCDCFSEKLVEDLDGSTDRQTVLNMVFQILDENEFINGDMRDYFDMQYGDT